MKLMIAWREAADGGLADWKKPQENAREVERFEDTGSSSWLVHFVEFVPMLLLGVDAERHMFIIDREPRQDRGSHLMGASRVTAVSMPWNHDKPAIVTGTFGEAATPLFSKKGLKCRRRRIHSNTGEIYALWKTNVQVWILQRVEPVVYFINSPHNTHCNSYLLYGIPLHSPRLFRNHRCGSHKPITALHHHHHHHHRGPRSQS
jgi:hypothetical protein